MNLRQLVPELSWWMTCGWLICIIVANAFVIIKFHVELWFPKIDPCLGIVSIGEVRSHKAQEKRKKEGKKNRNEYNGKLLGKKVPIGKTEERYITLGLGGLPFWPGW